MNRLEEAAFVEEVCRQLDASVAQLPNAIGQQLDASRQAALMQRAQLRSQDEQSLADAVSAELDDSGSLPPTIEARLDQIRQNAVARFETLQAERTESPGLSIRTWFDFVFGAFNLSASASMLATACILIAAVSLFYANSRPAGSLPLEEEIGLVATAEDIELYENLDFYLWLAENESLTL